VHVLCELCRSVRRQLNPSAHSTPVTLQVELVPVASGFASPLDIQQAGDGSGRLFVVEQAGRIKIIQSGNVLGTPYLDISSSVASGGETDSWDLRFIRTSHPTLFFMSTTPPPETASCRHFISEFRAATAAANTV